MKSQVLLLTGLLAGTIVLAQQPGSTPAPAPGTPQPGNPPTHVRSGQQPGGPPPRMSGAQDVIGGNFFPPELVMQNQKAIGLTEEQTTAIRAEMQKNMERFTDLQWQQSAAQETLNNLLKAEHVDEKETLAELDKLLTIEGEIKKLHLTVMMRLKNLLTPEQQTKLRELRPQLPVRQGPPPAEGGHGGQPQPDRD